MNTSLRAESSTSTSVHNAGFPPAPPEAHQKAGGQKDLYQEVTDQIVALLETVEPGQGIRWNKGAGNGLPRNFKTGAHYSGVNVLLLWATAQASGYASDAWLTYKQAAELGGQVKRGEKGTRGVFFQMVEKGKAQADASSGDDLRSDRYALIKPFWVFNLDQIDGISDASVNTGTLAPFEQIAAAEQILRDSGATLIEAGSKAFYSPTTDEIHMPERSAFSSSRDFYAVALHELTHWTGAKQRLNREFSARFGDEAYAFEELVAELGSAFLTADLGVEASVVPGHARYLASWLKVLRADKRAIFSAASLAGKAHRFIMEGVR